VIEARNKEISDLFLASLTGSLDQLITGELN